MEKMGIKMRGRKGKGGGREGTKGKGKGKEGKEGKEYPKLKVWLWSWH